MRMVEKPSNILENAAHKSTRIHKLGKLVGADLPLRGWLAVWLGISRQPVRIHLSLTERERATEHLNIVNVSGESLMLGQLVEFVKNTDMWEDHDLPEVRGKLVESVVLELFARRTKAADILVRQVFHDHDIQLGRKIEYSDHDGRVDGDDETTRGEEVEKCRSAADEVRDRRMELAWAEDCQ